MEDQQGQPVPPKPLSATISITRKINLGDYNSTDVFISIGNVTHETTDEDVALLLDGPVADTFELIKQRIVAKTKILKAEGR